MPVRNGSYLSATCSHVEHCVAKGLQMFGEDKLKASDWLAIQQAEQDAQVDRMVVLSDVWLDKPEVVDSLHTIFAGGPSNLMAPFVDFRPISTCISNVYQHLPADAFLLLLLW